MPKVPEGDALRAEEEVCHEAQGKRHLDKDPKVECLVRRKRLTSGPHHRRLDKAVEMGELSTKIKDGEPSSSVRERVMEEAQSGVPKMIDVKGHLSRPDLGADWGAQVRTGARTNV